MTTSTAAAQQRPDSELTREEVEQRNLEVVQAHFHNENPDMVDEAIKLYADDIVWEAPARGLIYRNHDEVKAGYLGIFETLTYLKITYLRRFATANFVFDDQIGQVRVVGDKMPNLPYPIGTHLNVRLVHCFELHDGRITREIVYEVFRKYDSGLDVDDIPPGSVVELFDPEAP